MPRIISQSIYLKVLLLFLSLGYFVSYIFWGLDDDIFYWCNSFERYSSEYTCTLSLWIGYLWSLLFGNSILSVRILALLFSIPTILIIYLYTFPRNTWYNNIHYLSIAFILSASSINIMYRADTLTTLSAVVFFVLLMERRKNPTWENLLMLCAISALAISARFPNIVVLLFISLINLYLNKRHVKKMLLENTVYLLLSLFLYYMLLSLLTQNIYWALEMFKAIGNDTVGTHSLSMLLERYFSTLTESTVVFAKAILYFFLPCFICYKFVKIRFFKIIIPVVSLLFIGKMVMSYGYWPFPPISGWDRFICFTLFILMVVNAYKGKGEYENFYSLSLYFLFMAYCIAGSDTGILKIFPFATLFAPIILNNFFCNFKNLHNYKYVVLPVFVALGIYFSFKHHDREERQIQSMNVNTNFDKLNYVLLPNEENAIYDQFHSDLKSIIKDSPCIFYGAHHGHWMYYLSGKKALYQYSYLMSPKDKYEIKQVLTVMTEYPDCYLIDSSNITDKIVLQYLSVIKSSDDYTIYKYKAKNI